jgi:predicted nucleic acid-binding protein
MILLDTNVLSGLMQLDREPIVAHWLRDQWIGDLGTTTINIAELKYGFARLASSKRRNDLEGKFATLMLRGLSTRIFDFDQPAADVYGDVRTARERMGRHLEGFDGLIAAIALSRGFAIATRNTADFEGCGVALVNPWEP